MIAYLLARVPAVLSNRKFGVAPWPRHARPSRYGLKDHPDAAESFYVKASSRGTDTVGFITHRYRNLKVEQFVRYPISLEGQPFVTVMDCADRDEEFNEEIEIPEGTVLHSS